MYYIRTVRNCIALVAILLIGLIPIFMIVLIIIYYLQFNIIFPKLVFPMNEIDYSKLINKFGENYIDNLFLPLRLMYIISYAFAILYFITLVLSNNFKSKDIILIFLVCITIFLVFYFPFVDSVRSHMNIAYFGFISIICVHVLMNLVISGLIFQIQSGIIQKEKMEM
jgi:hypothetical protein